MVFFGPFSFPLYMIDGEEVTESYASQLTRDIACTGHLEIVESSVFADSEV